MSFSTQLISDLRQKALEHDYTHMGVGPEAVDKPAYVYSIGLFRQHLPEMIVVGNIPPDVCHLIIADVVAAWKEHGEGILSVESLLLPGVRLGGPGGKFLPVKLREVDPQYAENNYRLWVRRVFPSQDLCPSYRLVQIVWPDDKGRFPDQPNYSTDLTLVQPLLPLRHTTDTSV